VIALSSSSNGNADLYVNLGESRLPTLADYDLKQATISSEILTIDQSLDNQDGFYIIGVYGTKTTTF
jgi:hypothetical protein